MTIESRNKNPASAGFPVISRRLPTISGLSDRLHLLRILLAFLRNIVQSRRSRPFLAYRTGRTDIAALAEIHAQLLKNPKILFGFDLGNHGMHMEAPGHLNQGLDNNKIALVPADALGEVRMELDIGNREQLQHIAETAALPEIVQSKAETSVPEPIHNRMQDLLLQYSVVGGMPEVVQTFDDT